MAGPNPLDAVPFMAADLDRVEDLLTLSAASADPYLTEICSHLVTAGGKRVRPGFCLASAAVRLAEGGSSLESTIAGAAAVELVHLGSLYHDDVMDEAVVRRQVESVNARWGNIRAILAGDFLLARASELAASLGVEVAALLAATIGRLCEGQVLELKHSFDVERTEQQYLAAIDGKTASLLGASCRIGAIVAGLDAEQTDALTAFGKEYGMAFQIVDDVLDIVSTEADLGKPVGHDLEEGVYTLPVIIALNSGHGEDLRALLGAPIDTATRDKALDIVIDSAGVTRSIERARSRAEVAVAALNTLPDSPGVRGLRAAADYLLAQVELAAA
ncbi:MAG: polyprenyl synthetase family protein [Actinobacteria bacterium]|nr:polyprenyl synthetase family protein [Actinomycetota bacterium]